MTNNPDPDPRPDPDNDHGRRARSAPYPYRDPGAAFPAWKDAFASRYQLTRAGERYLHFNGASYDGPRLARDHDRCHIGQCPYKTEAENLADLDGPNRALNREPDHDDPEAGL